MHANTRNVLSFPECQRRTAHRRRRPAAPRWGRRPGGADAVEVDVAGEAAAVGEGDLRRLLADDDDERVGLLGQAERGAVPRAEALVGDGELRERQDHAGRDDGVALDEHGAVVERAVGREQADDEVGADARLDAGAGFGVFVQADVALDGDDGADLGAGQPLHGLDQLLDDLALLHAVEEADHAALAEAGEGGAQLGVEHDDGGDGAVLEELLEDVADQLEVEEAGQEVGQREDEQAGEHLDGARAGEQLQHVVDGAATMRICSRSSGPGRNEKSAPISAARPARMADRGEVEGAAGGRRRRARGTGARPLSSAMTQAARCPRVGAPAAGRPRPRR
jgi:hypothetical protein